MAGGGALRLRTEDPSYLALVDRWWAVLLPRIARHLYIRGGNVLMVQARRPARCVLVECLRASVRSQHARLCRQQAGTPLSLCVCGCSARRTGRSVNDFNFLQRALACALQVCERGGHTWHAADGSPAYDLHG